MISDRFSSSNSETTGVPISSQGVVLQRGGEELILEKSLLFTNLPSYYFFYFLNFFL